jgi:hypothetical protein
MIGGNRNRDATPTRAANNSLPETIPVSGASPNGISDGSRRGVDLAEAAA